MTTWKERHLLNPALRVLVGTVGLNVEGIRILEVTGRRSGK